MYKVGLVAVLVIIGIILIIYSNTVVDYILNSYKKIYPGSVAYENWIKTPVSLSINMYLWNWTNPEQIYNNTVKPNFVQMGPYVFDEVIYKTNITWNDNHTITYRTKRIWTFNKNKSVGPLSDLVTTANPVSLVCN